LIINKLYIKVFCGDGGSRTHVLQSNHNINVSQVYLVIHN